MVQGLGRRNRWCSGCKSIVHRIPILLVHVFSQPVGLPIALTTRLVPAKNHETAEGREEMKEALMNAFANSAFSQIHITTPYGFNGTKGLDTSVNPIWRSVLYQVIILDF
jgi:hypothetical protein